MFVIYHRRAYARMFPRELDVTSYFPNQNILTRRRGRMSVIVNWGCSKFKLPEQIKLEEIRVLNPDVSVSTRKMNTFKVLQEAGLPIPRVVTDPKELIDGVPFYERGKYLARKDGLTGGKGIEVVERGSLPSAVSDFYSQVISKAAEIRLHIAGGQIICEQIKTIPAGSKVLIRNYDNGARFSAVPLHTRMEAAYAESARSIAVDAMRACRLDFGALDMALTKSGNWVIFEVNSAPGLMKREDNEEHDMPSTYEAYLNYFKSFMENYNA